MLMYVARGAADVAVVSQCSRIFVVLCTSELHFNVAVVCSVIFYRRGFSFVKIGVDTAENGSWEALSVCRLRL
jgi:hypothetical protein